MDDDVFHKLMLFVDPEEGTPKEKIERVIQAIFFTGGAYVPLPQTATTTTRLPHQYGRGAKSHHRSRYEYSCYDSFQ